MKKKLSLYFVIIISFITGCASSTTENENEMKVEIEFVTLDSWLNLMPGPGSTGLFHIAGEISVTNNSEKEIRNFTISKIDILIEEEFLSTVKVETRTKYQEPQNIIQPGATKNYQFNTPPGIKLDERIMNTDSVSAKFYLVSDEKSKELNVKKIELTRAY